ncbi:hypothetical protein H310_08995 [Aphanomyces invadans]|uniref:Uncharacterized protein n=1 Tax=Aphanomyces invadans TaxID=157072 RepID=A0A024TW79_9STRA|nr:hypothetical protein H310_08995 [Aphanomyces invadans]ETV98283.1 hypothetical protein H310_08995 [Aphanomyces invadans]|eukprot:XP_008873158.1 hypothetical protein H310_08995 [Aphanomyces invadans]
MTERGAPLDADSQLDRLGVERHVLLLASRVADVDDVAELDQVGRKFVAQRLGLVVQHDVGKVFENGRLGKPGGRHDERNADRTPRAIRGLPFDPRRPAERRVTHVLGKRPQVVVHASHPHDALRENVFQIVQSQGRKVPRQLVQVVPKLHNRRIVLHGSISAIVQIDVGTDKVADDVPVVQTVFVVRQLDRVDVLARHLLGKRGKVKLAEAVVPRLLHPVLCQRKPAVEHAFGPEESPRGGVVDHDGPKRERLDEAAQRVVHWQLFTRRRCQVVGHHRVDTEQVVDGGHLGVERAAEAKLDVLPLDVARNERATAAHDLDDCSVL